MAHADGYVLPNPAVPKTLGILNVIFAVILTALGVCGIGTILLLPYIQQFGAQQAAQAKENDDKERAAELKVLDDRAAAAATDEARKIIAQEREAVVKRPSKVPVAPDLNVLSQDPTATTLIVVKSIWDLGLDAVLLASGIGLIRLRGWGRKLCVTWAGLAIATALGLAAYQQATTGNAVRAAGQEQLAKFREAAARPDATPGDKASLQFAEFMDRYAVVVILGTVLAQITYPILCLILLNTPRARAACQTGGPLGPPDTDRGYMLPPSA